jgi:transducin (beta)-like 1
MSYFKSAKQVWEWHSGSHQPAIFEIAWQQSGGFNRIAVALENNEVGIVDVNQIPSISE